jgi:hypothetical protein
MAEDPRRQLQTPLDRERRRLEHQGSSYRSGGRFGCLMVGFLVTLTLLLMLLLALL